MVATFPNQNGTCLYLDAATPCGTDYLGYPVYTGDGMPFSNYSSWVSFLNQEVNATYVATILAQKYDCASTATIDLVTTVSDLRYQLSYLCSAYVVLAITNKCALPSSDDIGGAVVHPYGPLLCSDKCDLAASTYSNLLLNNDVCPGPGGTNFSTNQATVAFFKSACTTGSSLYSQNDNYCIPGVSGTLLDEATYCGYKSTAMALKLCPTQTDSCCTTLLASTASTGTGGTGVNVAAVAGGVSVAAVAVVAGVIVLYIYLRRRQRSPTGAAAAASANAPGKSAGGGRRAAPLLAIFGSAARQAPPRPLGSVSVPTVAPEPVPAASLDNSAAAAAARPPHDHRDDDEYLYMPGAAGTPYATRAWTVAPPAYDAADVAITGSASVAGSSLAVTAAAAGSPSLDRTSSLLKPQQLPPPQPNQLSPLLRPAQVPRQLFPPELTSPPSPGANNGAAGPAAELDRSSSTAKPPLLLSPQPSPALLPPPPSAALLAISAAAADNGPLEATSVSSSASAAVSKPAGGYAGA
ncbi:hypothetical protein HK405_014876 [Cladochytrium tenue]|nr:hypothetical protein HK405_014876 [Cladochytrium tenue]